MVEKEISLQPLNFDNSLLICWLDRMISLTSGKPNINIIMTFDNAISWFEIPVTDIDRAQKFYESLFDIKMNRMDMDQYKMAMFPLTDPMKGVGGTLCDSGGFHVPSEDKGILVYLNANPDIQTIVDRIEPNGGKIQTPKMQISPEYGYMAVFIDTEGNRIALHSVEGVEM